MSPPSHLDARGLMERSRSGMTAEARRRHLADRLAASRAEYTAAARAGRGGRAVQAQYAAEMDDLVRILTGAAGVSTLPAP